MRNVKSENCTVASATSTNETKWDKCALIAKSTCLLLPLKNWNVIVLCIEIAVIFEKGPHLYNTGPYDARLEPKVNDARSFDGWGKREHTDIHTSFMFYKYRCQCPRVTYLEHTGTLMWDTLHRTQDLILNQSTFSLHTMMAESKKYLGVDCCSWRMSLQCESTLAGKKYLFRRRVGHVSHSM